VIVADTDEEAQRLATSFLYTVVGIIAGKGNHYNNKKL